MEDSVDQRASVKNSDGWWRPTTIIALITAVAALLTALAPIISGFLPKEPIINTDAGKLEDLHFSCSNTVQISNDTSHVVRFELAVSKYPLSMQIFFKPDGTDVRSFQMFPVPTISGGLNPMNVYTDGQAVLMTIVAKYPLYANFDPAAGAWTEYSNGFAYACAVY